MHTTNYYNTFIEVAADCPAKTAAAPPEKPDAPTVASLHFNMIAAHPYAYSSDDIIFNAYAVKNGLGDAERSAAREAFFAKGQPCLRTSPLGKKYGWGIHCNAEGRVAVYPLESPEYQLFATDATLQHVQAMRSRKA